MTLTDPLPEEVVAVIVTVTPVVPTSVAWPLEGVEIAFVLLELQVAELVTSVPPWFALKLTVLPTPPFPDRLTAFPEQELQVTVTVEDCPTVTVVEPLTVPEVAVMVIPVVVFAMPLISPLLLTVTWVESELLQLSLLTPPVVPSLKFPVATNCKVWPTWRLGVAGVTVRLVSVGFTKKPRHPAQPRINTTVEAVNNNEFRPQLNFIAKPGSSANLGRGVLPIVAEAIFVLGTPKDMN